VKKEQDAKNLKIETLICTSVFRYNGTLVKKWI
jgi:hypothetical protein